MSGLWKGKCLKGHRKNTRGEDSLQEECQIFVDIYDDFYSLYEGLDDDDKAGLVNKANELVEEEHFGDALSSGKRERVNEAFSNMGNEELGVIMAWMKAEKIIEFCDN